MKERSRLIIDVLNLRKNDIIRSVEPTMKNGITGLGIIYTLASYHGGLTKYVFISDFLAVGENDDVTKLRTESLRTWMKERFDDEYDKDLDVIEKIEKDIEKKKQQLKKYEEKAYRTMELLSLKERDR